MTNFALHRSARTFDEDGRLRVAATPISKAAVNPYYGSEIPGAAALGLDSKRIYRLLRDPAELAKGAASFNGVQLLDTHIPVSATDPQDHAIVGAIGTDTAFDGKYLRASLIVWDANAIKDIENNMQRQLSAAYRYDADMTPGVFEGEAYDGVMRNIRGNHVALVESGRAGPDVMVGDAALKTSTRDDLDDDQFAVPAKRKLPIENEKHIRLAWDLLDDTEGLTAEEKATAKTRILHAARKHDMDVSDWSGAQDTAPSPAPKGHKPMPASQKAKLDAMLAKLKPFLATDADPEKVMKAMDEDEDEKEKNEKEGGRKANRTLDRENPDREAEDEDEEEAEKNEKEGGRKANRTLEKEREQAMDAAITKAKAEARAETVAAMNALSEAQRIVRPLVGDVFGMDSAEAVYGHALKQLGIDTAGVPPAAFPAMIKMVQRPGVAPSPRIAMDAAGAKTFSERFPNAARIKNI